MKRHTITLGATTTAGGKVISASSRGSINGMDIAVEGDTIFCKGCKGPGRIVCGGPRIPETWSGKQVALENDLCECACSPPPRLVPNQNLRYQWLEGDAATQESVSTANGTNEARGAGAEPPTSNPDHKEKFVLLDDSEDEPLRHAPYAISASADKKESGGVTDDAGQTHG